MGSASMRAFYLRTLAITFMMLVISSPGQTACGPGNGGCAPSTDETRAKIAQLLDSAFLTQHKIVTIEIRDGREIETQSRKKYEMRFSVVLKYLGDRLRCRINLCPALHNYLLEIDQAAKKATVSGWLFFEQTGDGWR